MSLEAFWFCVVPLQSIAILFAGAWGAFTEEGKRKPASLAFCLALIFAFASLTIAANLQ